MANRVIVSLEGVQLESLKTLFEELE
jgi:hypothetical protein